MIIGLQIKLNFITWGSYAISLSACLPEGFLNNTHFHEIRTSGSRFWLWKIRLGKKGKYQNVVSELQKLPQPNELMVPIWRTMRTPSLDHTVRPLLQLPSITALRLHKQFLLRLVRTVLQQCINHKTFLPGPHLLAISCKIHFKSKSLVR